VTRRAPVSFKTLLAFSHHLADLSGAVVRPYFRKAIAIDNKAAGKDFDPVTAADKGAERVIAKAISEQFPDHGILGEEYGARGAAGPMRWVIDPIDGTRAFIMGSPMWGTLIGLLDGETPILGLMDQPFTGERVWADARTARWRTADGKTRAIKTRECRKLADAVLTTTHPDLFEPGLEAAGFARVKSEARMTRYGGDCYSYCLLAAGFIDVIIECGLKPHDVVALLPILERAGATVTTWDGAPATNGGRIVVAGDPRLHEATLKLVNR
jgi:myo-inositol-1(or 4)-monophosphatase